MDAAVFPSSKRKAGDREAYVNGVLQHQPGLSSRFLAAVQTGEEGRKGVLDWCGWWVDQRTRHDSNQ